MANPIGINTYGFIWTSPAADCVRRFGDLGYRTFELMVHPLHLPLDEYDPADRRRLASALATIGAHDCTLNMPSLDHNLASALPRMRAFSVQMFRDAIDLASELGIGWLVVVPGRMSPLSPPSQADRTAWMRESLDALLPHAERRGVGLAVENVPMAAFPDAGTLGTFVRGFESDLVGICYDAANAHFVGESPAAGIRDLGDLIRVIHLSDTGPTQWRHDRIGLGSVPFAEIPPALDEIGFEGPIILEIVDADPEGAVLDSHRRLGALGFNTRPNGLAA